MELDIVAMARGCSFHRWMITLLGMLCCVSVVHSQTNTLQTLFFTVEPTDVTVKRGETFTMNCSLNQPNVNYFWTRNEQPVSYSDPLKTILPSGSLQVTVPAIQQPIDTTSGSYQCQATINQNTILSRVGNVEIAGLSITGSPQVKNSDVGDTVILQCEVESHPKPIIRWVKSGTVVDPEQSDAFARFAILPSGNLEIRDVHEVDAGVYRCQAENRMAGISETGFDITLTVNDGGLPPVEELSFIVSPPENVFVNLGESIVLEVAVDGPATFTWFKKNEELLLQFDNHYSLVGQGNLRIQNAEELDTGLYRVQASNDQGDIEAEVQLTILVPPRFVKRPVSMYARRGMNAQFECSWYSVPRPTVTWLMDGDPIPEENAFRIERNGEVGETLRIIGVKESDSTYYQCIVSNEVGNINAIAQLIVLPPGPTAAPDAPVPGVPESVVQTLVSTREISLGWRSPRNPNGIILTYSVMIGEPGKDRPRIINTTAPALTSATIKDLIPNTEYEYSICAWNSYGRGECTPLAIVQTQPELLPPSEPLNLVASVLSSTSARLSWTSPEVGVDTVIKYNIYFHPTDSLEPPNIQETSNVVDLIYDVAGLRPNTDYTFYIRAVNIHGEGLPSAEVIEHTFTDVPSEAPSEITIKPISHTEAISPSELMVFWVPPPPESTNGEITGYRLRYRKTQDSGGANNVFVTFGISQHRLSDLDPDTEYEVKILAVNSNGTGPWSNWVTSKTLKASEPTEPPDESRVPDEPSSLICYKYPNRIEVWWSPPLDRSIKVNGYILGFGPNIPDVVMEQLSADKRHFVIENLEPATSYIIKLRAFNKAGEGKSKYEIIDRISESTTDIPHLTPPLKVEAQAISDSIIMVRWRGVSNYKYTVRYKANFSTSRYKFINSSSFSQQITGLDPFTTYIIDVKATEGRKSSEYSIETSAKTDDAMPSSPPTDVKIVVDSNSSSMVYVNWMPPTEPNGYITTYIVYYSNNNELRLSRWFSKLVEGDEITTFISPLTCNTRYYVKIRALNRKGEGPLSNEISEVTPGCGATVPLAIDRKTTMVTPPDASTSELIEPKPSVLANVDEASIPRWLWFLIIGIAFLILFLAILLILCIACGCCACCADLCPCFASCCGGCRSCWAACCPCCCVLEDKGMTKVMYNKPPNGGDGPDVVFNIRNKPLGEMLPLRGDTEIDESAFIASETKGALESAYSGMLLNGGIKCSKSGSVTSEQATLSSDGHIRSGGGHSGTWSSSHATSNHFQSSHISNGSAKAEFVPLQALSGTIIDVSGQLSSQVDEQSTNQSVVSTPTGGLTSGSSAFTVAYEESTTHHSVERTVPMSDGSHVKTTSSHKSYEKSYSTSDRNNDNIIPAILASGFANQPLAIQNSPGMTPTLALPAPSYGTLDGSQAAGSTIIQSIQDIPSAVGHTESTMDHQHTHATAVPTFHIETADRLHSMRGRGGINRSMGDLSINSERLGGSFREGRKININKARSFAHLAGPPSRYRTGLNYTSSNANTTTDLLNDIRSGNAGFATMPSGHAQHKAVYTPLNGDVQRNGRLKSSDLTSEEMADTLSGIHESLSALTSHVSVGSREPVTQRSSAITIPIRRRLDLNGGYQSSVSQSMPSGYPTYGLHAQSMGHSGDHFTRSYQQSESNEHSTGYSYSSNNNNSCGVQLTENPIGQTGYQSESNLSQDDSQLHQPPTPHVSTHPLSSFSVPGPPPHYGTLPKSPPAQPRVKISAPSYSLLKRQQPAVNRNRSHPLPVVTPRAPDVTYRSVEATSPGSSTARTFSTEDLNAEMLNLEGLMKDLNAITQSDDIDC